MQGWDPGDWFNSNWGDEVQNLVAGLVRGGPSGSGVFNFLIKAGLVKFGALWGRVFVFGDMTQNPHTLSGPSWALAWSGLIALGLTQPNDHLYLIPYKKFVINNKQSQYARWI